MQIEISIGEYLDKISILMIKIKNLDAKDKISNCRKELNALKPHMKKEFSPYLEKLIEINGELYWVLQKQHEMMQSNIIDDVYIPIAKKIYQLNYSRFLVKKEINEIFESKIIEEKSY